MREVHIFRIIQGRKFIKSKEKQYFYNFVTIHSRFSS